IAAPIVTSTYHVRFEADCGNSTEKTVTVTVNPNPVPVITGPDEACIPGSAAFTTPANADFTYSWTITGGSVAGNTTTDQLSVNYAVSGSASVQVLVTDTVTGCSGTSAVHNITIYDQPEIFEIQSDTKITRR
ncbi:MAG TPA: hypothetical protein VE870_15290, partial [Bacteroidales bacterium]|nr:hypothetical protein [Bacteroidales bacterium]